MAEEHRCQTPEGHRLCANNCGFLGSSATMNLCSNCYGDLCLKQQQQGSSSLSAVSPPSPVITSISTPMIQPLVQNPSAELEVPAKNVPVTVTATEQPQKRPNRCTTCRKRVGLTGFKCRCGTTFCGAHRYPEVHGCTFDFKSAGREEIAKANPLVKTAKLQKI
ncbi:hypothetical protein BRARA_D00571 [Brassica rapa]|uniref:Zinc finger A20 and AN1 domain-containing stress-associated protein 4 n=1 Tax=Brassica campestris TaxID=3711 RepID=A0A397ZIT0_BRACM|nr:zinc finger A20 and AN1 domain-containing stress-associated protein 6-like [Brassica rapa]XP_033145787.1 zinc finger A20 and AN1 domain-containing stress-associated protein 6-like [Brassica rapa]RID65371.1 hypothetical protein BRARA_D00571 [Brassica rapa]RID65372.1 hypothetical protein BRARA_D00571 [Brassica rapa]CAG7905836.1 unnamed protein product [Brassica rapa]VDD11256.1 unnamed protein product [Brassica rapa]